MSDNDNSVRRVGRQDRKEQLDPVPPLFPESAAGLPSETPEEDAPDLLAYLPEDDPEEGLELLASLPPRVLKPNAITPEEERFPPIAPPKPTPKMRRPATRAVKPAPKPRRTGLYNVITLFALIGIVAWGGIFAVIWTQPDSQLNPFPPEPKFVYVTATPGSDLLAPTLVATVAPVPVVIDSEGYPFVISDNVLYAPNGNGLECAWGSIAGSITTRDGSPLSGYRVRVIGNGLDEVAFSGAALTFGPGGYEMPLGSVPQAQDYTVQLFSPQGAPLSPAYPVTTQAECEQNVAVVNFQEAPQ